MNSCLFCVIRRQAFLFVFWNWLYSSVHYLFFLLFLMFPCSVFYDFDFVLFESVVEGLFL